MSDTRGPRRSHSRAQPPRKDRPARDTGRTDRSPADQFLSPYTFVPAYPRQALSTDLADRAPIGHDRLHEGRWTGSIAVTLTVRTPLLLLDTARAERAASTEEEHLVYPVLTRDGRPHLPATAVKGMLRSAYEAVTDSRFGVFDEHIRPLGWRRLADGQRMLPVRVTAVQEKPDRVQVQIYKAARLPAYGNDPVRYPDGARPRHFDMVKARIGRPTTTRNGRTTRGQWTVRSIVPYREGTPPVPEGGDDAETKVVTGLICLTGRNAVGKRYERLFYSEDTPRSVWVPGGLKRWNEVIRVYGDAHDRGELHERTNDGRAYGPGEWIADDPGRLAWSPHLWDPARAKLTKDTLCYALTDGNSRNERITALYPVLIARDVGGRSPSEMLPADLHPAGHYAELSPADRVFGWVAPNGSATRPAAYRGRLRIGPVTCQGAAEEAVTRFPGDGLPLAILGQPKPGQGRFYLAERPHTPERPIADGTAKEGVYQPATRGLRGRKVYWHHAAIAGDDGYWSEPGDRIDPTQERIERAPGFREFRRPRVVAGTDAAPRFAPDRRTFQTTGQEQRDNQNRSVLGWINRDTTFTCTVQVKDLDEVELGALAWLLDLPADAFHRLGLGKPLGFGSVRLDIDATRTHLHSGEQYADHYRSLSAALPRTDAADILARSRRRFDAIVDGNTALTTIRAAFLAAAEGVPDLPVHYPRVRPDGMCDGSAVPPDPRGRSYEWFTANEKIDKGRIVPGHGQSLPAAETRRPLRLYNSGKPKK